MRVRCPSCLVPRPQYYASVIRFGSRGPGRKVYKSVLRYVNILEIRHRNQLDAKAWERAVQELGKCPSTARRTQQETAMGEGGWEITLSWCHRFEKPCFHSLRSWRDFARECFCFGSEAMNASDEAVRGLVESRGSATTRPLTNSASYAGYVFRMFNVYTKTKSQRFQIPPAWIAFTNLRFRDGLVWTVDLTAGTTLRFQIAPV